MDAGIDRKIRNFDNFRIVREESHYPYNLTSDFRHMVIALFSDFREILFAINLSGLFAMDASAQHAFEVSKH